MKSIFALTHPTMIPQLHALNIDEYDAVNDLWNSWMAIRDSWAPALSAAQAGDHDGVSICLSRLME